MTYSLRFKEEALGEWHKLGATVQAQFKKKLAERLENPHVPASRLRWAALLLMAWMPPPDGIAMCQCDVC